MRTLRHALAAIVSAVVIAGCGGDQPNPSGTATTKPADDPQYKGMLDEMKANRAGAKSTKH